MEIAKEIIENNKYVINTDASFDNLKKIGTYSVIIQKNNKVLKSIARKFKVQMKNSLECEIFVVYIAISIILTSYIGKNKKQEFRLSSDCQSAVDYFKSSNNKIKAFENNDEIAVTIKNTYKTASQRIIQNMLLSSTQEDTRSALMIKLQRLFLIYYYFDTYFSPGGFTCFPYLQSSLS